MTKLFGCLMVLGVLGLAAAVASYAFIVRPVRALRADFQAAVAELREVAALEAAIENTEPFVEPKGGELSAAQLERFVAVQAAVESTAAAERTALEARYEELRAFGDGGLERAVRSPRSFVMVLSDFASALRSAKEAQVAALNDAGLSLAEYRWIQREALEGLGVSVLPADISKLRELDVASLGRAAGFEGEVEPAKDAETPPEVTALVAPYREQLQSWTVSAVLGL